MFMLCLCFYGTWGARWGMVLRARAGGEEKPQDQDFGRTGSFLQFAFSALPLFRALIHIMILVNQSLFASIRAIAAAWPFKAAFFAVCSTDRH